MDGKCNEARVTRNTDGNLVAYGIDIPTRSLKEWCLHLCLLHFGVVDALDIGPNASGVELHIKLRDQYAPPTPRGVYYASNGDLYVRVTQTELEYWIGFFLDYLHKRDTVLDTAFPLHVDVALASSDGSGRNLDLTIGLS